MHPVIRKLHDAQLRKDLPEFRPGDTSASMSASSKGKAKRSRKRIQAFEGVVISRRAAPPAPLFTVRRAAFGTGVERIFPLHSPSIASVEVTRQGQSSPRPPLLPPQPQGRPLASSAPPARSSSRRGNRESLSFITPKYFQKKKTRPRSQIEARFYL